MCFICRILAGCFHLNAEGSSFACRDSYCRETILIKMKLSLLVEFPDKTRFNQPLRGSKNRKASLERQLIRFVFEIVACEATSWMCYCYELRWTQLLLLLGRAGGGVRTLGQ